MKFVNIFLFYFILLFTFLPLSSFGSMGFREALFDGNLTLSNNPKVGEKATLILDLTAISDDCGTTNIVFRMPSGISILGNSSFTEPYYNEGMSNRYSTEIKILKTGVYALQASVYTEIHGNTKAEHFFTYLVVTENDSKITNSTNYLTPSENGIDNYIASLAPPELAKAMGTLSIQGNIKYYDDNLTRTVPIKNLKVLLYDVKQNNSTELLGTTQTNNDGFYVFDGTNAPKLDDGAVKNLMPKIVFENEYIKITDDKDKIYVFDLPVIENVSAGLLVSDYLLNEANQQRPLGNIFNTALQAYDFLKQKLNWNRNKLPIIWPYNSEYASYNYSYIINTGRVTYEVMRITIKSQWDRTTFFHEYGHSIMMALYGYNQNNLPKSNFKGEDGLGRHGARTVSDPAFAMSEGWAEFCEALFDDSAFNYTQFSNRNTPNIEYNEWWKGKEGTNTDGEIVEGSVASILWDIADTAQSIDEAPNIDDDNISGMIVELWDIMAKNKPKKITDLWENWQKNNYGRLEDLKEIFANNGVKVEINQQNQPPVAESKSIEIDEDTSVSIVLTGSDPENSPLTYKIIKLPINGILSGNVPNLIYTPNANYNGTDSLNFTVSDGSLENNIATINITINPINDPPIANHQAIKTDEDKTIDILLTGNDVDLDQLTFEITKNPENGIIIGNPPNITYQPNLDFFGFDSFMFIANDGKIKSEETKIDITINPINDPPVANSQSITIKEDEQANIQLTGSDIDGDDLAFRITIQPTNGKLIGNPPDLVYEPNYGFSGTDNFTFVADDGFATSEPVKFEISINATSNKYDINKDGIINILDIIIIGTYFGKIDFPKENNPDVNRDGKVDELDFGVVIDNFGKKLQ